MRTDNVIRIVQTVLIAAVAGFAISALIAGHWWEHPTPAPPPPPPPTVDVHAVGSQVVGLLRDQWNAENLHMYGITLEDNMS